ncbi:MAG TPA: hypothetical protein VGI74_13865 [Streptosporangiaceae bacterium]
MHDFQDNRPELCIIDQREPAGHWPSLTLITPGLIPIRPGLIPITLVLEGAVGRCTTL